MSTTPRERDIIEKVSLLGVLLCVGGRGATGDPFKSVRISTIGLELFMSTSFRWNVMISDMIDGFI